MTWEECFHDALDTETFADACLDRHSPVRLVQDLSGRTGVQPERIWAMTLAGYVPWIIDALDTQNDACLPTYATQYQTLLRRQTPWMSKGLYNRKTGQYCLPGLGEPDPSGQALCWACLRTDRVPYRRIFWRLELMGSCPLQGCLLTTVSWPVRSTMHDSATPLEAADRDLLIVDGLSRQAVTRGMVRFRCGSHMDAAVYVRFLRSLIEELFCRLGAAGACADTIAAIWQAVGCHPYAGLATSKPFERLTLQQRRDTLRAVGRLLGDLPASLQRWMPLTAWGSLHPQRLPLALALMCRRSQTPQDAALSTHPIPLPPQPPPPCGTNAKTFSLREAVTAIEKLVQSDEGAEQLIRFVTAYRHRQTAEALWQLIREIRASAPAAVAPH